MAENLIDAILAGRVEDPDGGPNLSVPTKSVVIERSLDGREVDLLADLSFGSRLAVVSDLNTREAPGERVERALSSVARIEQVVLPGTPHADMETVALLEHETGRADALIAVGSGTINDLCKLASARARYANETTGGPTTCG
jgi:glycerol-1-phosphate dehydrogenase [NAD(P)+]